jgi:hypothetical protein
MMTKQELKNIGLRYSCTVFWTLSTISVTIQISVLTAHFCPQYKAGVSSRDRSIVITLAHSTSGSTMFLQTYACVLLFVGCLALNDRNQAAWGDKEQLKFDSDEVKIRVLL